MKVLQINSFGNLSTGRIAVDIYRTLRDNGHDGVVAFSRNTIAKDVSCIQIGSKWSVYADGVMSRLTDNAGFNSKKATEYLLKRIEEYDPDIIQLHNLHGYYINVELLFGYLRESRKPVVWTLHDCWSFTGHCCNFEYAGCEKWKTSCSNCPQKSNYPASLVDRSRINYAKKKALFTSLDNMVLVTPSVWLKNLVEQSYMSKYKTQVIRNGIDLSTFKPTTGDWIERNGMSGKKLVLGVAGTWSPTKGLDDMVRLSEMLPEEFQVVVVGLSAKQKEAMPKSIFGIERTYDSHELAEIYTAAYAFVNPSYDDNFPNVNIEALACGTPVITYQTGGGPEIITDEIGRVVPRGDIQRLKDSLRMIKKNSEFCTKAVDQLDRKKCYQQYMKLYESLL